MSRRQYPLEHTLLALLLGFSFSGCALALMPLLNTETQVVLLRPTMAISNLVGELFNWSENTRRHAPIGLWVQTAVVALAISTVSWFVLRTNWFTTLCQRGNCMIAHVLAVSSPWMVVVFGIIPSRTTTRLFFAGASLLLSLTLWLLIVVFARGARHRLAGAICVLILNSVQCGMLIHYLLGDMYLRPLAYVSLLLGTAFLSLRILNVESGNECHVSWWL